jgi:hypothetical protein
VPVIGLTRANWWLPAILVYALFAALFRPLSAPAAVAVLVPGLLLLVVRVRRPVRELPACASPRPAALHWGGLLVAFGAWELVAGLWGNDAAHPTLSLLFDPALEHYFARVLGYLGWLTTGYWLATR